jgi:hypothetical protein
MIIALSSAYMYKYLMSIVIAVSFHCYLSRVGQSDVLGVVVNDKSGLNIIGWLTNLILHYAR